MKNIKNGLALLLCAGMLLGFAACGAPDKETVPQTQPTQTEAPVTTVPPETTEAPEPTEAPETTVATEAYVQEITVTDAYTDAWDYGCYHIPQIQMADGLADEINAKIYNTHYSNLEQYVYSEAVQDYGPEIVSTRYIWGQTENLLSVVVEEVTSMNDITNYYAYTISKTTGKEVPAEKLYAAFGMDVNGFYHTVETTMRAYWEEIQESFSGPSAEMFQAVIKDTLASENVKATVGYINENGDLGLVANIYSLAGASSYYHLLNTVGTVNAGNLQCDIHHQASSGVVDNTQPPAVQEPENIPYDLVDDAWSKIAGGCCYHIPKINLPEDLAHEVNQKIYDVAMTRYNIETNTGFGMQGISYAWGQKEDLVSIAIRLDYGANDLRDIYIYTVSTTTGKEVSKEDVYALYNIDAQGFQDIVVGALQNYMEEHFHGDGGQFYQMLQEKNLSSQNIQSAVPGIGENGELIFSCDIYGVAGADCYAYIVNSSGIADEHYPSCKIH